MFDEPARGFLEQRGMSLSCLGVSAAGGGIGAPQQFLAGGKKRIPLAKVKKFHPPQVVLPMLKMCHSLSKLGFCSVAR
jgi:hypothetical protein